MVVRLRGGGEQRDKTRVERDVVGNNTGRGGEEGESDGRWWCALCVTGEDQRCGVDSLARSFARLVRLRRRHRARARQREHHVHERRDPFPTSFSTVFCS